MRLRKWIQLFKRPSIIITTAFAAIAIGGIVAWSQLPWILNASSEHWLTWLNVEKAELQIIELNTEKLHVENFSLIHENWEVSANKIEANFELKELLKNKRIHNLNIDGVTLIIKKVEAKQNSQSEDLSDRNIADIILSALHLPFDSIELTKASITIERNHKTKTLTGTARIDVRTGQQVHFVADASSDTERLNLEANLNLIELNGGVKYHGELEDPIELLDWLYPDWKRSSEEFATAAIEVGKVKYSGHFNINDSTLDNGYAKILIENGSFEDKDQFAQIRNLIIESETQAYDLLKSKITLGLDSALFSDLSIGPSNWAFSIAGPEMNRIEGHSNEIPWIYDKDIKFVTDLAFAIDLADDFEQSSFSFDAAMSNLVAYDYSIEDLKLKGEGSLKALEIYNAQVRLADLPLISSEFSRITITDPLEDIVTVDLAGTLEFVDEEINGLKLAPLSLQVQLIVSEEAQAWDAIIESDSSFPLVSYLQADQIEGRFRNILKGKRDSRTDLISAEDEFSISELNGSFDQFNFENVQLNGQYSLNDLDIDELQKSLELNYIEFVDLLRSKIVFNISWQGNQMRTENDSSIQWFNGYLKSETQSDSILLNATSGIVQVGPETLQQASLEIELSGNAPLISVIGKTAFSLEGEAVSGVIVGQVNLSEGNESVTGRFDMEPFTLVYSDIVSRHLPQLNGLSFSGEIDLLSEGRWTPEDWDISGRFSLINGEIAYPTHSLNANGLSANITMSSLAEGMLGSGQSIEAKSLKLGDLDAENLEISFSMEEWKILRVEEASVQIFDGTASLDRAEFEINNMDFDLMARFEEISLEPIVSQLDFFDGRMTGKVSGFVPISVNGRLVTVGEGHLKLVENSSAELHYNAENLFSEEDIKLGFVERYVDNYLKKAGLKPEDLVEKGLNNLPIDSLQIDLFRPDYPDTPIRIHMAGTARPDNIDIPIQITTNVNGTLAEVLNFLMRLNSLGSVSVLNQESN